MEPYIPLIAIVAIAFFIGLTSAARYHFPIAAGGLFLDAAQRISANDYRLPSTLPHYTDGGVPFAYPPLMLYVLSALHDVSGISLLNLERVLPVLYTPVYLVPFYFLAKDFLKDRNTALFATFIMAVSPSAFFYHFDAGGVVRSPGIRVPHLRSLRHVPHVRDRRDALGRGVLAVVRAHAADPRRLRRDVRRRATSCSTRSSTGRGRVCSRARSRLAPPSRSPRRGGSPSCTSTARRRFGPHFSRTGRPRARSTAP